MISEVSKLPVLEELELVFPKDRVVDLAPLGKVSTLKSLDVLASSSTDYRWASSLKNLEEMEVSTYGKERVELQLGESASIKPVVTIDGSTLTPREYYSRYSNERRLGKVTATGVTALRAGIGRVVAEYANEEEQIPGMPNLRSARFHSTWQFGIRDTATFTPIGLAQNPSLEGHGAAVVGDLLLAPVSNYPFTSLQWTRNGQAIPGTTGESYRLTAKDANAAIALDYSTRSIWEDSVYWVPAVEGTARYGIPIASSVKSIYKPKITGSKIVTEKVAATVDASYFPGFKRSFQWYVQRSPIEGATGATFVPGAKFADLKVSVKVSFKWSDEFYADLPSIDAVKVGKGSFSVGKPTITGTAQVGNKLTAKAATSSPASQSVSYQLTHNGQKIKGATGKTYSLTKNELNGRIAVSATYSKANYNTKTVTSASTSKVVPAKLKIVKKPAISGKKSTGKVLKVSAGTYNAKGVTVSYQWLRSGKLVSKATKPSYTVTKSDAGKNLTV